MPICRHIWDCSHSQTTITNLLGEQRVHICRCTLGNLGPGRSDKTGGTSHLPCAQGWIVKVGTSPRNKHPGASQTPSRSNYKIVWPLRHDVTRLLKDHPIGAWGVGNSRRAPLLQKNRRPKQGDPYAFRVSQVLRKVDSAVVSPKTCRIAAKNSRLLGGF